MWPGKTPKRPGQEDDNYSSGGYGFNEGGSGGGGYGTVNYDLDNDNDRHDNVINGGGTFDGSRSALRGGNDAISVDGGNYDKR